DRSRHPGRRLAQQPSPLHVVRPPGIFLVGNRWNLLSPEVALLAGAGLGPAQPPCARGERLRRLSILAIILSSEDSRSESLGFWILDFRLRAPQTVGTKEATWITNPKIFEVFEIFNLKSSISSTIFKYFKIENPKSKMNVALPKAWMSWSTGKDSAWALDVIRKQQQVEIVAPLTTVNASAARVAMHAVRQSLLDAQAAALGLPVVAVPIPSPCPNAAYEQAMEAAIGRARAEGVTHVVFGDLFLEDIRKYREEKLASTGITPLFPLWGLDTRALAR